MAILYFAVIYPVLARRITVFDIYALRRWQIELDFRVHDEWRYIPGDGVKIEETVDDQLSPLVAFLFNPVFPCQIIQRWYVVWTGETRFTDQSCQYALESKCLPKQFTISLPRRKGCQKQEGLYRPHLSDLIGR